MPRIRDEAGRDELAKNDKGCTRDQSKCDRFRKSGDNAIMGTMPEDDKTELALATPLDASAISLNLPDSTTQDQCLEILKRLVRGVEWAQFLIGDCLNFGMTRHGEKFTDAVLLLGIPKKTLEQYCWVAKAFPENSRRGGLSWSHHKAVAAIEDDTERNQYLDDAISNKWSKARLIQELKEGPALKAKSTPAPPEDLLELISATRYSCAKLAERFGTDRYFVLLDILRSESESLWEMAQPQLTRDDKLYRLEYALTSLMQQYKPDLVRLMAAKVCESIMSEAAKIEPTECEVAR